MNATSVRDAAAIHLQSPDPARLVSTLRIGAERLATMIDALCIDQSGAADRAEYLAAQLEGIKQACTRLSATLRERQREDVAR